MTRMLFRQSPPVFFGNYAVAALAGYQFWQYCPHGTVLAWGIAIYALTTCRIGFALLFHRRQPPATACLRWACIYAILSGVSGCLWGSIGLIFFLPHNIIVIALICIVLAGMTSGCVAALSCFLPAYWTFALPAVLPLTLRSLAYGGSLFSTLGALSLFLLFVNLAYSRTIQRTVRASVLLRFENAQLLENLTIEQQRATAADQAKSLFLAAASHDLRQPTHALGLFVSALHELGERPAVNPEELKTIALQLRQALKGLGLLLNTLLDISRLDTGTVEVNAQRFPLQNLFSELRNEFDGSFRSKPLALHIISTSAWVLTDPVILRQMISNLVSNALRYTLRGRVTLGCRQRGDDIEIQVLDTGIGISAEHLSEIFREFYQVANVTRNREQGLGLGLAIVQRSADLLGAKIRVTSTPGKGSMFSVRVPCAEPTPETIAPPWPPVSLDAPRRTVLVVDDDHDVLSATTLLLDLLGHDIIPASTIDEALAATRENYAAIDFVLSDYRLGDEINGMDVIHGVRGMLNRHVDAALITGDTALGHLRDAAASGFTLLHKPLDTDQLRHLLSGTGTASAHRGERH
jgi:signal transduction histidine kinase/ActR/RegA family two-component response regulator